MADKVSLSQDEVDKLMGISAESESSMAEKKHYNVKSFLSAQQIEEIQLVCKSVYKHFKLSLRKKFDEPKIRKLKIASIEEQNVNEFFDMLTDNDFVYEVNFGSARAFIKFDTFLFCALSGLQVNTRHKINLFQSEVLKKFVAESLAEGFARQLKEKSAFEIMSLYGKDFAEFHTDETGLCLTINWNENLHSFGIEKVFLTKELVKQFRAVD